jgi:hypothetical protein
VEQLTFGADQIHPEVSPSGSHIAFVQGDANPNGGITGGSLHIMPFAGGPATEIVPNVGAWEPTWSPDEGIIYFTRAAGEDWDAVGVPSAGGVVFSALTISRDEIFGDISHDGTRAMVSSRASGVYNLFEASVTDPSYTQLTFDSNNTSQAKYSPDGTRIVFMSRRLGGISDLYEMELATQATLRLTFSAGGPGAYDDNQLPEYSPDGTLIAFSAVRTLQDWNVWILPVTGSLPFGNELRVGDGQGRPGSVPVTVPVFLENTRSSPAIEFRIHDIPDWLTVTGVQPKSRAIAMTASFVDNGGLHVLLYNPLGGAIPPGSGEILDLQIEIKTSASLGDSVTLELSDIVMADPDGNAVEVDAFSGTFLIARITGDINGDNRVDVGDLVRLVEIILGTGLPASPEELGAADCNEDLDINALDVACLTDLILGGPGAQTVVGNPVSFGQDMIVRTEEPVRGIQFSLGAGNPMPEGTPDLDPLSLYLEPEGRIGVAFDPQGGEWERGERAPFRVDVMPAEIRAYGPGGRALPVEVSGNQVRIGKRLPVGLQVLPPSPNPFRTATTIHFSTDVPTTVSATIYDIRGARVSTIPDRPVTAGRHTLPWEARSDNGLRLPAGVYIAVVESDKQKASVRLTHLGH